MAGIYQLLIELEDSEPSIWRRVKIPESVGSFLELYDIIRILLDWPFTEGYVFQINDVQVFDFAGAIDLGEDPSKRDCSDTFLDEFISEDKTPFTFYYYHSEEWKITLTAEKVLSNTQELTYPVCIEGEGAGPPSECAGIEDYKELLNGLSDPAHPRNRDAHDMLGENWDPHFFNKYSTNHRLMDYAQQWEDIVRKVQIANEGEGLEEEPDHEYEQVRSLQSFEDLLKEKDENLRILGIVEDCLQDPETKAYQAFTRLKNEGLDEERAKELIRDVFAIEEFYEIKHGIIVLEERFRFNLENLPEKPQEIPNTQTAIEILDACSKGIPFKAIEYLQQDQSEVARNTILHRIKQIPNWSYEWNDPTLTPILYGVAAEGHLCEALIDPVVSIFTTEHPCRTDVLYEQGEILNELLAEQFPDLVIPKVIEAIQKAAQYTEADLPVLYLFNALFFGDLSKYEDQLLTILKNPNTPYLELWAQMLAHRQLQTAKPIIEAYTRDPDFYFGGESSENKRNKFVDFRELEEAQKELESGESQYPDVMKPEIRKRTGWKHHYADIEPNFYEEDQDDNEDFGDPLGLFEPDDEPIERGGPSKEPDTRSSMPSEPLKKQPKPGRNDPCHCGSGKKYKKCCLKKDEGR